MESPNFSGNSISFNYTPQEEPTIPPSKDLSKPSDAQSRIISNMPDSGIIFTPKPATPTEATPETKPLSNPPSPLPPKNWKKISLVTVGSLAAIGLLSYGAWAGTQYSKYASAVPAESLLPEDPNLVLNITTDPNSETFRQFEGHLQKFPGYSMLQKEFSKTGKPQTLSESLQELADEYSLDFQKDLKPALGQSMLLVINDLSPLGSELQKTSLLTLRDTLTSKLPGVDESEIPREIALEIPGQTGNSSVLGTSSYQYSARKPFEFPTLDFVAVTEVRDLSIVEKTFSKLLKEKQDEVKKHSFKGYAYYEITLKTKESEKSVYNKLYGAIVGKNFFVSSSEDSVKDAVSRGNQQRWLSFVSDNDRKPSLSDNNNFSMVSTSVPQEKNVLASTYIKLNFDKFFKDDSCQSDSCLSVKQYLKHPEDIIYGFRLFTDEDGIGITSINNRTNFQNLANQTLGADSAKRIPGRVENLWPDILTEHGNINELYYSFKKNNLTDEGLREWDSVLNEISSETGFHPEKDFIDQIDGSSRFLLFTGKNARPQGAIAARIKDPQRMYSVIEKIFTLFKESYIGSLEMSLTYMEGFSGEIGIAQREARLPQRTAADKDHLQRVIVETRKQLEEARAMQIVPSEIPVGKTYSLNFFSIPFSFSLENNELIFSSNAAVTNALLTTARHGGDSLADNALYARAQKHLHQEGVSQSFAVTQGIANVIAYVASSISSTLAPMNLTPHREAFDNELDGMLGFLRTVKFIAASNAIDKQFTRSALFMDIKELPADEKAHAEKVLENMASRTQEPLK